METDGPRSAFMSYSWDSEKHKTWVRKLASKLVRAGVDVKLDQWDVGPGDSLTQYMEKQIATCDYVIVICTPFYAKRSQARTGGVGYEQQIISGHIAAGISRQKFIPIIRGGGIKPGTKCAIPQHFSGIYAIDMRNAAQYSEGVKSLLKAIYGVPKLSPPKLGKRFTEHRSRLTKNVIRLPVMELDGWHLISGVAINQEHPKTFWVPPESDRLKLKRGDFVKLIFEIAVLHSDLFGGLCAERMWVKVTGWKGSYLTGTLANRPLSYDETDVLKFGDQVVFLPEHIIDIDPGGKGNASARQKPRARKALRLSSVLPRPKHVN